LSKPRSGAPKRVGVGLLAGALFVFGIALAPNAGATSNVTVTRLAGATRYGTAAAIAGHSEFTAPKTAIVATGENFPDALAASGLAGSNAPAPIVLTQKDTYTSDAKSALGALKSKGVSAVTLVGGTAAVSDSVKNAIAADGFTVTRTAGADRYATAAAIASAMTTIGTVGGNKTALIATGENFPDALAGGPAAYAKNLPILLVTKDAIPSSTSSAISSLGIKHAVILGGTAVVSDAVKAQLDTATGTPSDRLAGQNRYGTAAAVGTWEKDTLAFALTSVVAATGNNFPDALAAGPLGGELGAPIVLTASCPAETTAFLTANAATISTIYLSGGTAVIDQATSDCLEAAAEGGAATGVTSRPELISSSVVSTVASGLLAGTTVRYVFDEAVQTPTAANFWVVDSSGNRTQGSASGGTAKAVSGNANAIDVLYPGITSSSTAAGLTLATVDLDAVKDAQGEGNPEDDAPLGSTQATTLPAGTTNAPDLTSVGNFVLANATVTFVDFVFDQAATNVSSSGYTLVPTNSTTGDDSVTCTYDSGTGTTTIKVTCPNATTGVALTASSFARGATAAGTVAGSTNVQNSLQAADVTGGTPDSGGPDLVSASFNLDATTSGGSPVDTATLVFDQGVATAGATSTFKAYFVGGTGSDLSPNTVGTSTTTPTQVLLTFSDGALTGAVGVNIADDAVLKASGTNQGHGNEEDEVGVQGSTAGTTGGSTTGPDLTAVVRTAAKDIFGNPTGGFNVTYVFDEDVDLLTAGNFFLYLADGTRLQSVGAACANATDEAVDNTVTCASYTLTVGGTTATNAQVQAAVLGTVNDSAVDEETGALTNNEAARPVTSA
jgi:putative cell wall-binding protein